MTRENINFSSDLNLNLYYDSLIAYLFDNEILECVEFFVVTVSVLKSGFQFASDLFHGCKVELHACGLVVL